MHIVCLCAFYIARYHSSSGKLKLTEEQLSLSPLHVMAAYALNPLTIATCVAMSTGVFHNFVLSLALLFILRGIFLTTCYMYDKKYALWNVYLPNVIVFHTPLSNYLTNCNDLELGRFKVVKGHGANR